MPAIGSGPPESADSVASFEVLDVVLQRVRVAGEDQVFGQVALFRRDLGEGHDVRRVDDGQIEPGLDAVIEEDRVEHLAAPADSRPNETFETPRIVMHAGHRRLNRGGCLRSFRWPSR